jgi:hypothetical protein
VLLGSWWAQQQAARAAAMRSVGGAPSLRGAGPHVASRSGSGFSHTGSGGAGASAGAPFSFSAASAASRSNSGVAAAAGAPFSFSAASGASRTNSGVARIGSGLSRALSGAPSGGSFIVGTPLARDTPPPSPPASPRARRVPSGPRLLACCFGGAAFVDAADDDAGSGADADAGAAAAPPPPQRPEALAAPYLHCLELLLAAGADPGAPNAAGRTPAMLVACGALGTTPAAPRALAALLASGHGHPNATDPEGRGALALAARHLAEDTPTALACKLAALEALVSGGADVNAPDAAGMTPLMHAADGGCGREALLLLMEAGADAGLVRGSGGWGRGSAAHEFARALRRRAACPLHPPPAPAPPGPLLPTRPAPAHLARWTTTGAPR